MQIALLCQKRTEQRSGIGAAQAAFRFRKDLCGITIVVLVVTPVSLFVASFIAKRTFSMFKAQSETRGEQTALIDEMIGNQKIV